MVSLASFNVSRSSHNFVIPFKKSNSLKVIAQKHQNSKVFEQKTFFNWLNERLLTSRNFAVLLQKNWCIDKFTSNEYQEFLIKIIKDSAIIDHRVAAANAITILNRAGVNLSGQFFRRINIPGADLSRAIMTQTDLSYANLKNVIMKEAILDYSKMICTSTQGIDFGQEPAIEASYQKISHMAVSPDGKKIITAGKESNRISIWNYPVERGSDPDRGSNRLFANNNTFVTCIAYSICGKMIFFGDNEGHINVWNSDTREKTIGFGRRSVDITTINCSPNEKMLLSGCKDGSVIIWEIKSRNKLYSLKHVDSIECSAFSPNNPFALLAIGKILLLWGYEVKTANIFDEKHLGRVTCVAFSSDGNRIISGSVDKTIRIWNLTGQSIGLITGHVDAINCVKFSLDGEIIISGSDDNTVRVWSAEFGHALATLRGHNDSVTCLAIWERKIFSGSLDTTINIWNMDNLKSSVEMELQTLSHTNSLAVSPNECFALLGDCSGILRLWDCKTGKEKYNIKGHSSEITHVAFSPDGQWIYSVGKDNMIKKWDSNNGERVLGFELKEKSFAAIAIAPNGESGVSGVENSEIALWDSMTGKIEHIFKGHLDIVNVVLFSPDGSKVISGSKDTTIRIWDIFSRKLLSTFKTPEREVACLAISSDSKWLLSGTGDFSVRLWECETGLVKITYYKHCAPIKSVNFSHDDMMVVSSDVFGVHFWDPKKREVGMNGAAIHNGAECLYEFHSSRGIRARFLSNKMQVLILDRQPSLQLWQFFYDNEKKNFKHCLSWSSSRRLSAQCLNLLDVKNMSDSNRRLLHRLGASEKKEDVDEEDSDWVKVGDFWSEVPLRED